MCVYWCVFGMGWTGQVRDSECGVVCVGRQGGEVMQYRKIYCKWERYVRKLVKREVKYISIPRSGS